MGPSSTAFPLCFPSEAHRHSLPGQGVGAFQEESRTKARGASDAVVAVTAIRWDWLAVPTQ